MNQFVGCTKDSGIPEIRQISPMPHEVSRSANPVGQYGKNLLQSEMAETYLDAGVYALTSTVLPQPCLDCPVLPAHPTSVAYLRLTPRTYG